jgi:hypothetical protein
VTGLPDNQAGKATKTRHGGHNILETDFRRSPGPCIRFPLGTILGPVVLLEFSTLGRRDLEIALVRRLLPGQMRGDGCSIPRFGGVNLD